MAEAAKQIYKLLPEGNATAVYPFDGRILTATELALITLEKGDLSLYQELPVNDKGWVTFRKSSGKGVRIYNTTVRSHVLEMVDAMESGEFILLKPLPKNTPPTSQPVTTYERSKDPTAVFISC